MVEPFKNVYHLRKVAETQSRPCAFCYKITSAVLITSDGSSDFFYTCESHLKDHAFASPLYDQEYNDAKAKKDALDREVKALKLKWDEKNRYAGWDKLVSKFSAAKKDDDTKDDKKKEGSSTPKTTEESQIKDLTKQASDHEAILQKQPRTYQLNKDIYKIQLEKKYKTKTAAQSSQLNQKLKDPTYFPSVPQGPPSK